MYILLSGTDVVLHISSTIGYQENGNPLVDHDTLAYARSIVADVVEVETVPSEVEPMKYCYSAANGFYSNPNWVEPTQSDSDAITPDEILNALDGGAE